MLPPPINIQGPTTKSSLNKSNENKSKTMSPKNIIPEFLRPIENPQTPSKMFDAPLRRPLFHKTKKGNEETLDNRRESRAETLRKSVQAQLEGSGSGGRKSSLTTELDRIAPRFDIDASQIDVLDSPSSFYETLKTKILSARRRIYLSTLYIGKTEHDLIVTLHEALRTNPELKVSILTDALRGTRETPEPSCASLLADLIVQHGSDRVEIRMFHTPNLTGLRKRFIPKRINEGWGLQHMKLYGFDDEIMLSGCELSDCDEKIMGLV
ncbi:MAG: hypothetical protein Q9160_001279 [Pyrenula sp. 1 TL-2023]